MLGNLKIFVVVYLQYVDLLMFIPRVQFCENRREIEKVRFEHLCGSINNTCTRTAEYCDIVLLKIGYKISSLQTCKFCMASF